MLSKLLTWILLAFLCSFIIKVLLLLDLNKRIYNHVPGPCKIVKGAEFGSEDIELLPDGTALISSGLIYSDSPELIGTRGKILMYDFESKTNKHIAETLKIEGPNFDKDDFHPHGLSSYTSKGRTTLYVVNHRSDGDAIECFTFNKAKRTLTHTKSIRNDHIYAANDLVVIGPDKFYVTNDHYFRNHWLRRLEVILMLNLGNIVYFDGKGIILEF